MPVVIRLQSARDFVVPRNAMISVTRRELHNQLERTNIEHTSMEIRALESHSLG
jgi:hypothetical protein